MPAKIDESTTDAARMIQAAADIRCKYASTDEDDRDLALAIQDLRQAGSEFDRREESLKAADLLAARARVDLADAFAELLAASRRVTDIEGHIQRRNGRNRGDSGDREDSGRKAHKEEP